MDSDSRMRMRMIEIKRPILPSRRTSDSQSQLSTTTSSSLYGRHNFMGWLTTSYCAPVICQVLKGNGTTTGSTIKLGNVVGRQKSFSVVVEFGSSVLGRVIVLLELVRGS